MLFVCRRLPANEKNYISVLAVPLWWDQDGCKEFNKFIRYRICETIY